MPDLLLPHRIGENAAVVCCGIFAEGPVPRVFFMRTGHTKAIQHKEVFSMSKKKNKSQGRDLRGSAPVAGQNRTDTAVNAQDPMADPLEMRMKREGHDM